MPDSCNANGFMEGVIEWSMFDVRGRFRLQDFDDRENQHGMPDRDLKLGRGEVRRAATNTCGEKSCDILGSKSPSLGW